MHKSEPNTLHLIVVRNPFDRHIRDERMLQLDAMPTVAALMAEYLPVGAAELSVAIDGEVITRDEWESRTLANGEQLVVMPVLHDSGKQILGYVLLAVVMYYTAGAGGTAAGGWISGMTGTGTLATGMIGAGLFMAGSMLISPLLAPNKQALPGQQSANNQSAYSWNPATTQQPGGVVARAYGLNKLYGNIIAGYVDNSSYVHGTSEGGYKNLGSNTDQSAHLLIDLGTGPYQQLYDFRINDQPIGNYTGALVTARLGNVNQEAIRSFNETRAVRAFGAKIVLGTPVVRSTVGSAYDALEILLTAPNGLWHANTAGGMDEVTVLIGVELSADNGATWDFYSLEANVETSVLPGRWTAGYYVKSKRGRVTEFTWHEVASGSSVQADHVEGAAYSPATKPKSYWRWLATPITVATTLNNTSAMIGSSTQPVRLTIRADNLVRGTTYLVRCTNLSADQTSSLYSVGVYLDQINEVMYDDFTYPRTVLAGVDALATNQLSGSIKFSCMAQGAIVRVWNGSAWVSQYSNNPAWVCWDILTQPVLDNNLNVVRYDGLDPSRLLLSSFVAWAAFCDVLVPDGKYSTEKRCTFDGIFDTQTSMWDAALLVCATARAQLVMRGTNVSVVYDDVRSAPAQLFNVGNTAVSGFKETFLPMQDRAAVIEIGYLDAAQGYVRDTLTVVNPSVTEAVALRTNITLMGVTRASQAWREANFRLQRNALLRRSDSISVDIDALACTVGDLIWLQSDVTAWGVGGRSGLGSTTTNLVLDVPVTLVAGKTYEVRLRLSDDTIVTRTITTGAGTVSAVDVSLAFPSAPILYDPWAIGETGKAIKEFIVLDVARDGEQRCKLQLIEYNASLYGLDSGIPALPTPNVSASPLLPVVNNIRFSEVIALTTGNVLVVHLDIYFDSANANKVQIYQDGQFVGESNTGVFRIQNVGSGGTVFNFSLRPVSSLGVSPSGTWASQNYTAIGLSAAPADITGLVVQSGSAVDALSWTQSPDLDVRYGGAILVRHSPWTTGAVWESSTSAAYPLPGTATNIALPLRAGTYFVKAQDSSGKQSVNAAVFISNGSTAFTFTPAGAATLNVQEDPAFPGTFTNTYHDTGVGNTIELVGAGNIDDAPDFDAITNFDYYGGVVPSGTYQFATTTDLGSVKSARLTATLSAMAENVLDNFDDRTTDIDTWLDFDGAAGAPVDAWVEVRTTNTDPAGAPVWSAWSRLTAASFTARAFQYRAQLTSGDPVYNIAIDQLRIKVESL